MLELLKDKSKGGLKSGPIMLTCYTNHALDQFLSKITEYTKNVVRLGGRTKNEELKQYSIREAGMRKGYKLDKRFYRHRDEQKQLVKECIELSKYYEQNLQIRTIQS